MAYPTEGLFVHCFQIELEFGVLVFVEGGKPENPEKNPRSKDENQQQTQPTYVTGPESNPGHIGGNRALSPLRHPCNTLGSWCIKGTDESTLSKDSSVPLIHHDLSDLGLICLVKKCKIQSWIFLKKRTLSKLT